MVIRMVVMYWLRVGSAITCQGLTKGEVKDTCRNRASATDPDVVVARCIAIPQIWRVRPKRQMDYGLGGMETGIHGPEGSLCRGALFIGYTRWGSALSHGQKDEISCFEVTGGSGNKRWI